MISVPSNGTVGGYLEFFKFVTGRSRYGSLMVRVQYIERVLTRIRTSRGGRPVAAVVARRGITASSFFFFFFFPFFLFSVLLHGQVMPRWCLAGFFLFHHNSRSYSPFHLGLLQSLDSLTQDLCLAPSLLGLYGVTVVEWTNGGIRPSSGRATCPPPPPEEALRRREGKWPRCSTRQGRRTHPMSTRTAYQAAWRGV